MRRLRPAFVMTVGTIAVCACTPPRTRKASSSHPEGKPIEHLDWGKLTRLNPLDDKRRMIFAAGERCLVQLPYDSPPKSWQPPKTKQVDCPPSMDDAAWDQCGVGTLYRITGTETCVCTRDGNPPPPPMEIACPK